MRRFLFLSCVLVVVTACSTPSSPSTSVAGTWGENFAVVGATTSTVALRIQYDYGVVRTFTGSLSDPSHLSGMFDDGTSAAVFVRR
jgi:hypothetical protein